MLRVVQNPPKENEEVRVTLGDDSQGSRTPPLLPTRIPPICAHAPP